MNGIGGPVKTGKDTTLDQHSEVSPDRNPLFICQGDEFIGRCACFCVMPTVIMGYCYVHQGDNQGGGLADLTSLLDCMTYVCERRVGIAKRPHRHRAIGEAHNR